MKPRWENDGPVKIVRQRRPAALNLEQDGRLIPPACDDADPDLAGELLDRARMLKARNLRADGIAYGPQAAADLTDLCIRTATLRRIDPATQLHHRATALAFWINIYNTLIIHAALSLGVKHRVTEVPNFFKRATYRIGGLDYSADVIEHGLLRANRGHPLRLGLPQLMPWNPRRRFVIRPFDIRIHFALNCGGTSCPPIKHYRPETIDAELELAARSFCSSAGVTLDSLTGKVLISRIFLWYARDFGFSKSRQLAAVLRYLDNDKRDRVQSAAAEHGIRYADYDWTFA